VLIRIFSIQSTNSYPHFNTRAPQFSDSRMLFLIDIT
jgi:hypothetical protein